MHKEIDEEGNIREVPNINFRKFHTEPIIQTKDYTTSYQWNQLKKTIKPYKHNDTNYYCTPSSDVNKDLDKSQCRSFFEVIASHWSTYDDFLAFHLKQFRYVTVNEQNWKLSVCSCWYWCKYYKCKHMISTCYRLNLCNFPQEAKQIQIGHNRKRGRPRKTAPRLQYQTEIGDEEYVLSDTDNEPESPKKKQPQKRKNPEPEPEPEYDLFADALPTTSKNVQPCSKQTDNQDLPALPPPTTPANKKQKSIFKPTQSKTTKTSSKSSTGTQPNSRRSHLNRACNTSK